MGMKEKMVAGAIKAGVIDQIGVVKELLQDKELKTEMISLVRDIIMTVRELKPLVDEQKKLDKLEAAKARADHRASFHKGVCPACGMSEVTLEGTYQKHYECNLCGHGFHLTAKDCQILGIQIKE